MLQFTFLKKGNFKMEKVQKTVFTVAQYKILEFVNNCFYPDYIKVEVYDPNSLKVTDNEDNFIVFTWNGTGIIETEWKIE